MLDRREALKAFFGLPAATEITRIPAVSLKPKDVIVISAPGCISEETARRLQEYAQKIWPDHTVVAMGDGLTVKIVSGS